MKSTNSRVISLRTLLTSLVGILAAVALALAVSDLQRSLESYRKAELLVELNGLADHCLQAAKNFAFERGRSAVVLQEPFSISTQDLQFIDRRRQLTDSNLEAALAGFPEALRTEGEMLRKSWDKVRVLRSILDTHFSMPYRQRDPTLPERWLLDADDLMAGLENMLTGISSSSGDIDARFERLGNLRILALQFRDVVGKASRMLASELSAGRVPGPGAIASIRVLRGRSQQLWSQLDAGVARPFDANASAAVEKVQMTLFGRLYPYQDQMIDEAVRNNRAPITLSSYLAASVPALDSTIELVDSLNRGISDHAESRFRAAKRQAMVSLANIGAILTLAGVVLWLMLRRFTRPLNQILRRIDKLIELQSATPLADLSTSSGGDFERVHYVLGLLEKTMEDRPRIEAALAESERVNSSILACTPQAVIVTAIDGSILVFSPGAEKMLGYSADEIVGKSTPALFHDQAEIAARAEALTEELGFDVPPDFNALVALTRAYSKPDEREWTYVRKDGRRIRVLLAVTTLRNEPGKMTGYLGVASDVTERARLANELSRLAYSDHLTHLPNRRLLHDRLHMALNKARRERSGLAVMLIDLDRFKPVNDAHGHAVGDSLLRAVAERMKLCLRESDTLARLGGDEFMALLSGIDDVKDAVSVAEKIRSALGKPFDLGAGIVADISCSIGIALYPGDGLNEKILMKKADDAMYRAKASGRNAVSLGFDATETARSGIAALPIVKLVWHNSYLCGEASIDREHKALFQHANRIIDACLAGTGHSSDVLLSTLDDLLHCVEDHFRNEEAVLARHRYAGLDAHMLEHRKLLSRARELRREAQERGVSIGDLVAYISIDVVADHMLKEDYRFFPLFRPARDPLGDAAKANHER